MSDGGPDLRIWRAPDGQAWISAVDLIEHLRARADRYADACNAAEVDEHATAHRTVATEMRDQADRLDVEILGAISGG